MRKITFIIILLTGFIVFSSCTKKEKLLTKSWRYEKIISEATEKDIAEEKERLKYLSDTDRINKKKQLDEFIDLYENGIKLYRIEFKKEGTYIIKEGENKESANGTWKLTDDKKILILNALKQSGESSNYLDSLEILTLNEKELKLRLINQTDQTIILIPE